MFEVNLVHIITDFARPSVVQKWNADASVVQVMPVGQGMVFAYIGCITYITHGCLLCVDDFALMYASNEAICAVKNEFQQPKSDMVVIPKQYPSILLPSAYSREWMKHPVLRSEACPILKSVASVPKGQESVLFLVYHLTYVGFHVISYVVRIDSISSQVLFRCDDHRGIGTVERIAATYTIARPEPLLIMTHENRIGLYDPINDAVNVQRFSFTSELVLACGSSVYIMQRFKCHRYNINIKQHRLEPCATWHPWQFSLDFFTKSMSVFICAEYVGHDLYWVSVCLQRRCLCGFSFSVGATYAQQPRDVWPALSDPIQPKLWETIRHIFVTPTVFDMQLYYRRRANVFQIFHENLFLTLRCVIKPS
jgi:hypothetical protein